MAITVLRARRRFRRAASNPGGPGLKIAILGSRGFPSTYGGFETLVRHLVPYLRDAGHDVSVYCREGAGIRTWKTQRCEGIDRIHTPGVDTKSASTLSFGLTSSIDALCRRFDVIVILNVANGFYLPILKRSGAATIVNVDGIEWKRQKWSRAGRMVFRVGASATARYADHLVTDSEAISEEWQALLGRTSTFIPYGAPVYGNRPTSRVTSLGLEPGKYYLVVARLSPENNAELILDAHYRVTDGLPLVVVGTANYENPIVSRLQASQHVKWLGHIADQDLLTDLWAHCGVYLHGHSVGGTNPALLQALGAGSPTLALQTPYNLEVLGHAEQLFPPDPDVLATKMTHLAHNHDLRMQFRFRGQERVRTAYSWDSVCKAYLYLCEEAHRSST